MLIISPWDRCRKIKNKSSKIYNNIKDKTPKIKTKKLYEEITDYFEDIHLLILEDGNFILNKGTKFQIINGTTFKIIKKLDYKSNFEYISDIISLNKNEILFCNGHFNIGYIEMDDNYNIRNSFDKLYKNKDGNLNYATLKLLQSGKILYMGSKSSYKMGEDKLYGLTKIYIMNFNRVKNELFLESKINAFETYFYEIKNKNEYLINIKNNFVSVVNSKTIRSKKDVEFKIYSNMKLLNDKYFIQGDEEGQIYLYNLDTFQLIKTFYSNKYNDINNIDVYDNMIFTYETQRLECLNDENFVKKWEFIEEEKEIKCLGYFEMDNNYITKIVKVNNKKDICLLEFSNGFRFIKIIEE